MFFQKSAKLQFLQGLQTNVPTFHQFNFKITFFHRRLISSTSSYFFLYFHDKGINFFLYFHVKVIGI